MIFMSEQGCEQLMLYPEDFPVSLSALPGSERALREALLADFTLADYPWTDFEDAWKIVQNAPTINAVSVIRCENCKNHTHDEVFGTRICQCSKQRVKANDFCSYGELREEIE